MTGARVRRVAAATAGAALSFALLSLTACTIGEDMPRPSSTAPTPTASSTPTTRPTVPSASDSESPSPTPTESATSTPTAEPSGSPTSSPPSDGGGSKSDDEGADPVSLDCDAVLSPQQVYDFNPNFGDNPDYSPRSLASRALDLNGVACSWLNQTSEITLDVSVAHPSAGTLRDLEADAAAGESADDSAGSTYFAVSGGNGVSQTFDDGYWIVVSSPWFTTPDDSSSVVDDVVANLP